jgi:DNA mismatch repair ATPase MutS
VIPNDLRLDAPCRLVVVSGSNMSGKSTLLKAIGVNLVLAQAGAPVRARSFETAPFALGASLVLRDSLLEGRSRFYAEIVRLRDVVGLTDGERPVLFLLDELLSGTNSHDRAIGAEGVLRGLVERGACGFITTHDLALTGIADAMGERAANWHLEDRLVDGKLEFDYRLRPGVVARSNALELMRSVGLVVGGRE